MQQFFKSVLQEKQTHLHLGWTEDEYICCKFSVLEWTFPLKNNHFLWIPGGWHKKGKQPFSGAGHVCTEVHQNPCKEAWLANRGQLWAQEPPAKTLQRCSIVRQCWSKHLGKTSGAGVHQLPKRGGQWHWASDPKHRPLRRGIFQGIETMGVEKPAFAQLRRRLGDPVVERCNCHVAHWHCPANILCGIFQNSR